VEAVELRDHQIAVVTVALVDSLVEVAELVLHLVLVSHPLAGLELKVLFVLFGPVVLVHSRQLVQGIYK